MDCQMDAASHRMDGNETDALALEAEAEELQSRAATIRTTQPSDGVGA